VHEGTRPRQLNHDHQVHLPALEQQPGKRYYPLRGCSLAHPDHDGPVSDDQDVAALDGGGFMGQGVVVVALEQVIGQRAQQEIFVVEVFDEQARGMQQGDDVALEHAADQQIGQRRRRRRPHQRIDGTATPRSCSWPTNASRSPRARSAHMTSSKSSSLTLSGVSRVSSRPGRCTITWRS
jgi:hypothetical protein